YRPPTSKNLVNYTPNTRQTQVFVKKLTKSLKVLSQMSLSNQLDKRTKNEHGTKITLDFCSTLKN
ncbi:hypothetical protein, partial [Enterococcus faecium]|uniref:hypothetical protein n=1 Tax=Enterococcus faecium TaxID=1352 RepID=UPI003D16DE6C